MKWNSEDMNTAAANLNSSASKFSTSLENLSNFMSTAGSNYSGPGMDSAKETFVAFKTVFAEHISNIINCSKYLTDTVIPDLIAEEKKISDYFGGNAE